MTRPSPNAFHVSDGLVGKTLAEAVRRGQGVSWGEAERRILSRLVSVHGNLCLDPDRRMRAGDVVNFHDEAQAKPPEADDLDVVHQDRHLIVVNKPAGLTSVREPREAGLSAKRRERQPTLDELLEQKARKNAPPHRRSHNQPRTIFAVHRLDRDTSGLMLFARTAEAERLLIARFQAHDIDRAYLAVVRGHPGQQTIRTHFVRDRGDGKRGSLPPGSGPIEGSQLAVTHVRPLEAIGEYHVVECALETGRTHQIRIHLSELGFPVCGDAIYGPPTDPSNAPRQALHAYRLGLEHPFTGQPLRFERDWPYDLRRWLAKLK